LSNVHNGNLLEVIKYIITGLKAFSAAHRHITKNITAVIQEPQKACDWLTTGITY
jgi:hypothetical protein